MRLFLLCALFIASSAFAQDATKDRAAVAQRQTYCQVLGEIFLSATDIRDQGRSPETAYDVIAGGWMSHKIPGITRQLIKDSINTAYFDPAFTNAGGFRLARQVEEFCLRDGKPKYQPLR